MTKQKKGKKYMCISSALLLFFIMCLSVYAISFTYANNIDIYVNGDKLMLSQSILNVDDCTYIPLRDSFEKIGYTVAWNEKDNSININNYAESHLAMDIDNSLHGTIEGGQEFTYISQKDFSDPTYNLNYEQYFEEFNMIDSSERKSDVIADAQMAVKIAKEYFYGRGTEDSNDRRISYQVAYDKNHNAWIVIEKSTRILSRGMKGIAIRSVDGKVLGIYEHGLNM